MKQNFVATNIAQDFTEAEKKQARDNIGVVGNDAVVIYSGSSQMSSDQMSTIRQAVSNNGTVTLLYGASGGSTYWNLLKYDSSGYDFGYTNGTTVSIIHVTQQGYVTRTNNYVGAPTVYDLGSSDWYYNLTLSGQTSGTSLANHYGTVSQPISLYSGKKYLITATCSGTADYITTSSEDSTKRWMMHMSLTQSDYALEYPKCVTIGTAQFYFQQDKGSRSVGYHFIVPIHPVTSIITPTSNLNLTSIVSWNSGNILGCSSSSPTKLFTDYNLGVVTVQEIL